MTPGDALCFKGVRRVTALDRADHIAAIMEW